MTKYKGQSMSQTQLRLHSPIERRHTQSLSSNGQSQHVLGKDKEYFDNLQSCYEPENIEVATSLKDADRYNRKISI